MPIKTFVVKGTYYYQAAAEVSARRAVQGSPVRLQRDPSNKYDSNAVRVLLAENGAHLGHVPRVISALVSARIISGSVRGAQICSVSKSSTYLEMMVAYEVEEAPRQALKSPNSRLAPLSPTYISRSPPPTAVQPTRDPVLRQRPPPKRPTSLTTGSASSDNNLTRETRALNWGKLLLVLGLIVLLITLVS